MNYPFCTRCLSKNNLGQKICGSCDVTLAIVTSINTAIKFCGRNKKKASRYLGFKNRTSFYKLTQAIPEIYDAWDEIQGVPQDEVKKILGTKVMDKATITEQRMWKKILRLSDYHDMTEKKQQDFADWFHSDSSRITFAMAKEKLKEMGTDVIWI